MDEEALEGLLLVQQEEKNYFPKEWVSDSNTIQVLDARGRGSVRGVPEPKPAYISLTRELRVIFIVLSGWEKFKR